MTDRNADEPSDESGEPETQPFYPGRGPDPDQMAQSYLPESDDWQSKTILDVRDPAAIAALSQMAEMYPEVNELQGFVDGVLDTFFRTRTSVGGQSRQEYHRLLASMYGGNIDEQTARNAFVDALAGEETDD